MESILLPGRLWRESEFVFDTVSRHWITGACGPNASAMAASWADQRYHSTLEVYRRMRASGRCAANGAATLAALAEDIRLAGYAPDVLPYHEPMLEADWRQFLEPRVGRQAIVLEVARGQLLVDSVGGRGENARDLRYHFLLLVGWHEGGRSPRLNRELPPGWWCSDGDNFAKGDVLQLYPDSLISAACPCAALAISARSASVRRDGAL